ncbi:patatin-like phospholipase family protein [Moraxella nasibovis]|uniref:patatin-like phospholipase family protein n=1 Tax=Moraxella nasibovis TaxID=2904120 RepID=UPI00240EB785|nr:patatin-like phospholipase family protein [Moraxella nasibovis]WFF38504.1 patatin-like phospholipase family protein [Moraxella nasibovis]
MKKYTAFPLAITTVALTATLATGCTTAKQTVQTTPTTQAMPTLALVLGGGGTRGYAHIGAIKALEEHGIRPNLVVGTSAGAMVGAIYASGKRIQDIEHAALTLNDTDLLTLAPSKQGLIDGTAIRRFVNDQVKHQTIEKFPTRFAAVATDAHAKTAVTIRQGDAGLAVQASSSLPNLFIAPRIPEHGGKKYTDGGQVALLPSAIAKSLGADMVIAVDVMATPTPPAQDKRTAQPTKNTAGIARTDTGIKAVWGDEVIEFPINKDAIAKSTQGLPISIDVDKLLGMIPNNAQIPLPANFPKTLPKTKGEMIRTINDVFLQNTSRATTADIQASDVLIAPDLSAYAIFDPTDKEKIIQAGYDATLQQMDQIKALLAKHGK